MPGSTMHLMFAKLINPNGSIKYFTGAIAPDAVRDRYEKDKTHFRNMPDRAHKLMEFAKSLTKSDFNEGMITHLYLDWRWDSCEIQRFADLYGKDWFIPYRRELSRIGHFYSNNDEWCKHIWRKIYDLPMSEYEPVPSSTDSMLRDFINTAFESQMEQRDEPKLFCSDEVDEFLKMTALEYPRFIKLIK